MVLSKFFVSQHRIEKFCKGTLLFPEIVWYRKKIWIRRGLSHFSFEIFMSQCAENFRIGILLFLRKVLVSKSFMDENEVSHFSVANFWSHSAEKFRGHPFNVSENLGYRKISCIIGGITFFRLKVLCRTVPKNYLRETFFVSQCFWYQRKIVDKRMWDSRFSVDNFLSHHAENFRRNPLVFHYFRLSKTVKDKS